MLCFDDHRGLTAPIADGYIMKPDIPPLNWTTYNSETFWNDSDKRIFFHETSGRNHVSMKQCCVVESAAKNNPDRPIQLFLRPSVQYCSSDMKEPDLSTSLHTPTWLKVLSEYPNVQVILLNVDQYFQGSPLEDWYKKGDWRNSKYVLAHLADYIRIQSLFKGGGFYLDIDIITLKPYDGEQFRNFLLYGNAAMDEINNSAMHLERGHWLINEIANLISKDYEPDAYIYNGPEAIQEVMSNSCGLMASQPHSNRCNDVHLLPDYFFYPIPSIFSHLLFQNNGNKTEEVLKKIRKSFGLHLWNSLRNLHQTPRFDSNQIFGIVGLQNCPVTAARAVNYPGSFNSV